MMNIKVATKYQLNEYMKSVKIFYLVVVLVMLFFGITTQFNIPITFDSGSGIETTSMIFLFILGLNSFKETFLMMLQNSTTRRTMFLSRLITILATGVFMAIVDRFIVNLAGLLNDMSGRFYIKGMYEMIFERRAASLHIIVMNLEAVLITIGVYTVAMLGGYFITVAYYRMSKAAKIAVSIGVPASLMILLPIVDFAFFKGRLTNAVGRMFEFIFGGTTGNPYNLLVSCILLIIVALGLTWLLIRKAVDKK